MSYRDISGSERLRLEAMLNKNMGDCIDELVGETIDWLGTPQAAAFFTERQGRINEFYRTSGIQDIWDDIINNRASRGADVAEQVYDYARSINSSGVVEFTPREAQILNNICDNQYELVRNVGQQELQGIRRSILEDVASGVNPRQTSLREVQLQPINGMSPTERAVTIARTETARCINQATLQQYRRDGVELVQLVTGPGCCDECEALAEGPVTIDEAEEIDVPHPRCRCTWRAVVPRI